MRDKVARVRIRAQKLRTRVLSVHIHPSRAQQWASLAADITTFLAEYEEYESWGGWKCFLRKNIIKRAYDVALNGIEGFKRAASVRLCENILCLRPRLTSSSFPLP